MSEPLRQEEAGLTPDALMQITFSFAPSRVLSAGLQLRVFSHMAGGKKTVAEIAGAAEASERGMRMLLDALVGLELLSKRGDAYELTPLSAQFLVRESEDYVGAMMENDMLWETWGQLSEVVRTGQPPRLIEMQEVAEQFFAVLIRSLHIMNREPARRAAEALGAGASGKGLRVVDVACGSGVWSIAIAEADPEARVTAQDFPAIFNVTREYLKRHGVEERFDFLPGDLKRVDFGENRFDVAILGNIVHSEGEESSRDLFKRLHRALRAGGRIVIVDMIPNDERTGPPFALFFALNMLLNTEVGGTYTLAEYTDWLTDAGFARVETADIGSHSPLIIAHKE
ncbi:MAG TPA: methyltransferase [Pyrinomonadaceae bacterium]|jgi:ubiquinone/menaquinone biosynthesis C-methylase UbiE